MFNETLKRIYPNSYTVFWVLNILMGHSFGERTNLFINEIIQSSVSNLIMYRYKWNC